MFDVCCLCEFMSSPVGIDCTAPRFSWSVSGISGSQSGYRILVSQNSDLMDPVWDSGIVPSGESNQIYYQGEPLRSGTRYYFQVQVFEAPRFDDHSRLTEIACGQSSFFTAILPKDDDKDTGWDDCWIGGAGLKNHSYLVRWPIFVDRPLRSAAAFIASPNYYRASLDGFPLDDTVLNGTFTDPGKTLLYDTYPLNLPKGPHVLGVELGNGWHAMDLAERHVAKNEHILAVRIRMEYEDGQVRWLQTSPEKCYVTEKAPNQYNSIYFGETQDARLAQPGFDTPDFRMDPSLGWQHAFCMDPPGGKMRARGMEPIRIWKELSPVALLPCPDGSFTIDFGQNFAGWIRVRVQAPAGTKLVLRYAELIHEDHTINDSSLNGIHATDTYFFRGGEPEVFEPRFTYHGFRYVQVEGLPFPAKAAAFTGCAVSSDVEPISRFHSNLDLLNRFYKAMLWSERSNLFGIPTDCPQRAERVAWLNDMTVRNECALYQFRLPALYRKWCRDIRDTQGRVSGAIADTAPFYRNGQRPADPVSSSFLLVPWNVYCFYGDRRILEENYEACRRWTLFLKRHSDDGIVRYSPMGDWASPKKWCDPNSIGAGSVSAITPTTFMATGYQYLNWSLLERMARVLGREADAEEFSRQAGEVREAFMKAYYHTEGYFATGSQACNAFPLYLGMLDDEPEKEKAVLAHLLTDLQKNEMHLTTGNLCSRYVVEVLFSHGYADEALTLLTQKTYPGWGYMLENGATTLWERWEKVDSYAGVSKMASHNHAMTGSVCVTFHKYLVGIRVREDAPGFEKITIRPVIPSGLNQIDGSLRTVKGLVRCLWEKTADGELFLQAEIPFGSVADIWIPVPTEHPIFLEQTSCDGSSLQINGNELKVCRVEGGRYVHQENITGKATFRLK